MEGFALKTLTILKLVAFLVLLFPSAAYAYIDPGIGSMLLQGLAVGFFAVLAFGKNVRSKISNFFKKQDD